MGAIDHASGREGQPESGDLRRLLIYWEERRGARAFPRRADIDPVDFSFMLDRVALTEVHGEPRRFRLRVVGSYWHRRLGFESTGMWMHDFPSANQRQISEDFYNATIDGRLPRFQKRDMIVDDQLLHYEILQLPLSEDGEKISMIMTGIGQE
jgi:hypothetical protein